MHHHNIKLVFRIEDEITNFNKLSNAYNNIIYTMKYRSDRKHVIHTQLSDDAMQKKRFHSETSAKILYVNSFYTN